MTVSFRKQRNEFHKFLEQQDVGPDLDKFVVTGQCWRIHKVGSVNGGRAAVFSLLSVTATRVTASSIKQGLHDERSGRLVDVTLCTRPTVIASTHAYSKTKNSSYRFNFTFNNENSENTNKFELQKGFTQ